jgi:hypothetical protein
VDRPVDPKGVYQFKVLSQKPSLFLKVLDAGKPTAPPEGGLQNTGRIARHQLAGILKDLAGSRNQRALSPQARAVLTQINEKMPSLIYSGPDEKKVLWLTRQLADSGLFYENKLFKHLTGKDNRPLTMLARGDLKALLMGLQKELEQVEQPAGQVKTLLDHVTHGLRLIEQDQMLNLSSLGEDLGWFWFIPGDPEQGIQRAEVFFKKRDDQGALRFHLFVDLTRAGKMEAAMCFQMDRLDVDIGVEDQARMDLVKAAAGDLADNLGRAGFNVGRLSCGLLGDPLPEEKPGEHTESDEDTETVHVVI